MGKGNNRRSNKEKKKPKKEVDLGLNKSKVKKFMDSRK